jgi:drug/metabolite transporter (DMT)-like permease
VATADSSVESSTALPARTDRVPLGILYMIGATVMFSASSAASKWLVESYPVGEILVTRTGISLLIIGAFVLSTTGFAAFRTARLGAHGLRASSQFASQICILLAFSLMPLASAVAINFSAPLFATLASAFFLKEAVGPARWIALLVGFFGVLIVTNPGADTFTVGALFALGNAVLYGTVTAAVRGMSATESTDTLVMYQLTLLTALFACLIPFGWKHPANTVDAAVMLANGVTNAFGQYWWTRALHLAPASAVGPFYYLMLVWAIAFGLLIWGDFPTLSLLVGSAIVVGSGLFLLWRESRREAVEAEVT